MIANLGFGITHVELATPLPLVTGIRFAADYLAARGRPPGTAYAIELRSPVPFTESGFRAFNEQYVAALRQEGFLESVDTTPIARSNMCPSDIVIVEPSLHAFSFTEALSAGARASALGSTARNFVLSGRAEAGSE